MDGAVRGTRQLTSPSGHTTLGSDQRMAERVTVTADRRMASLETHLKIVRESIERLPREPDMYKVLAGSLRVPVCEFGKNRPLLLDLLDDLELGYSIGPNPDLPFPIPLIDEEPEEPPEDFNSWPPARIWEWHRARGKTYPLREYTKRALAVYVLGDKYSYEKLVRTLAEQSGAAHEDSSIDRNVLEMESIQIGGLVSHSAPLAGLAEHVLAAGRSAVTKAASMGYAPHYLVREGSQVVYPPLFGGTA